MRRAVDDDLQIAAQQDQCFIFTLMAVHGCGATGGGEDFEHAPRTAGVLARYDKPGAGAAALGAGLAQFPAFLANAHLRSGTLVEVLPTCRPAPLPINLMMPGSRTRPARVRALVNALAGEE